MAVQNKTEKIMVRLTPTHMRELKARANAEGYRLSEWAWLSLIERARNSSNGELCGQMQGK